MAHASAAPHRTERVTVAGADALTPTVSFASGPNEEYIAATVALSRPSWRATLPESKYPRARGPSCRHECER